jgi:hypothetical protein
MKCEIFESMKMIQLLFNLIIVDVRWVFQQIVLMNGKEYFSREFISFSGFRLLWMKHINEAIDICRRRRLLTSMLRAPESSKCYFVVYNLSIVIFRFQFDELSINWENFYSRNQCGEFTIYIYTKEWFVGRRNKIWKKYFLGNNPYCIMEMNNCQRQTTPILCETSNLQWNVSFRFLISDLQHDSIKCFIYNRSKYTTDRKIIRIFRFLLSEDEHCRSSWFGWNSGEIINWRTKWTGRFLINLFNSHKSFLRNVIIKLENPSIFSSTFIQ